MKVVRLMEPGKPLAVGTAEKPRPGPKDVLVRVAACALVPNAKDVASGATNFTLPSLPAIFGMDTAGTISELGSQVVGLSVGDRVYVDPYLTCETCKECRRGRRDLCPNGALRGFMTWSEGGKKLLDHYSYGGLSQYLVSPHNKVARLPDSIDFPTAARLGYLGTCYGALRRGDFRPGQTLLINGVTGTLGVASVAIALGMGASLILGTGRNRALMSKVEAMAPSKVMVRSFQDGDIVDWVRAKTDGAGCDLMLDYLGVGGNASNTTNRLLRGLRRGGKAFLAAGSVTGEIKQEYWEILVNDVAVQSSMWFTDEHIDSLIAMMASGVVDSSYLEQRVFPLDQANAALELVGTRPGGFTNVVVEP